MNASPNHYRRAMLKAMAATAIIPSVALSAEVRMTTRAIPSSGEALPVIGLGTWQTLDIDAPADLADARESLRLFVERGGTVIDSSPMYGRSEAVVGTLANELKLSGKLFLATKVWTSGREQGLAQMEESFRRMGTRRMDLMQIHNLVDAATHAKTLRASKESRRIRYWGITHYHEGAYSAVEAFLKTHQPDFLQINYSLAEAESGEHLIPLARDLGVAVIANRPFAEGALFNRVRGKQLPSWAAEFEIASWAQFFLKWILGNPAITCVIPATRNPKYILDNTAAGLGRLPDAATRARMGAFLNT